MPTYVASGTIAAQYGGSGTLTPPLPAGIESGDTLVAHVAVRGTMRSLAGTMGAWTKVGTVVHTGAADGQVIGLAVLRKTVGPGETAPSFQIADFASTVEGVGVVLHAVRGANAASPIDVAAYEGHNDAALRMPSVETTGPNRLLLGLAHRYGGPASWSIGAPWTQVWAGGTNQTDGGATLGAGTYEAAAAGVVAAQPWVAGGSGTGFGASATLAFAA